MYIQTGSFLVDIQTFSNDKMIESKKAYNFGKAFLLLGTKATGDNPDRYLGAVRIVAGDNPDRGDNPDCGDNPDRYNLLSFVT